MTLQEIRKEIDAIDPQIRELLMKRLDCSSAVADAKIASGDLTIFRADREEAILKRLGEGVPEERLPGYLSVVRKIMETSRMYQYGLMYDKLPDPFGPLADGLTIPADCRNVCVSFSRANRPNALAQVLSMIADYGYDLEEISQTGGDATSETVIFQMQIRGDLNETHMKKLMFQLAAETQDFRIVSCK